MFSKIWYSVSAFVISVFVFLQPAFAQEEQAAEEKPPEWVLPYILILLFLSLAIIILIRSAKRSDTAFSIEEQTAQKEEAMKKMLGH